MAQSQSIYVGNFLEDSSQVPQAMQGASIYYSPKYQKFAIVSAKTGKRLEYFEMPQYRTFADNDIILFDENIVNYIEDEYDKWYDEVHAKVEAAVDTYNETHQEDVRITPGDMEPEPTNDGKSKDPTRHIKGYFVTSFIIAMLIIVGRLIILPLVLNLMRIS